MPLPPSKQSESNLFYLLHLQLPKWKELMYGRSHPPENAIAGVGRYIITRMKQKPALGVPAIEIF